MVAREVCAQALAEPRAWSGNRNRPRVLPQGGAGLPRRAGRSRVSRLPKAQVHFGDAGIPIDDVERSRLGLRDQPGGPSRCQAGALLVVAAQVRQRQDAVGEDLIRPRPAARQQLGCLLQSCHGGIRPALGEQKPRFRKENVRLALRIIGMTGYRGHFGRPCGQAAELALVV